MPVRLNIVKNGQVQYVRVWRSFRNEKGQSRSKVVENYGRLDRLLEQDPLAIEKIQKHVNELNALEKKSQYSARMLEAQTHLKDMQSAAQTNASQEGIQSLNLGIAVIKKIWDDLKLPQAFHYAQNKSKIEYDFAKTGLLLTALRLLAPSSKRNAFDHRLHYIANFDDVNQLQHLYRSLDKLSENKDYLLKHINRNLSAWRQKEVTLAFYDVTTYAYESRSESQMRGFGISKDHKVNEVQVVLGLVVDENGLPFDYELFNGNTNEFGTMCPIIERLKKTYNIKRMIVVADRGLNSNENLLKLNDLGCEFIIAQKVRNVSREIQGQILSEDNWSEFMIDAEGEVLLKCKNLDIPRELFETKISQKTGRKYTSNKVIGTIDTQWVVSYSASRATKDLKDLARAVEKAQKAITENPSAVKSTRGWRSLVKTEISKKDLVLNQAKISDQKKWAGYYAICTNVKDMTMSEVMQTYHNLWRIEDCFRITKTSLEARPCYVWNDEHIKGHFLSCYIALVIQRVLELTLNKAGLALPTNQILEKLRQASVIPVKTGRETVYVKTNTDSEFDRIMSAVGLGVLNTYEDKHALSLKLKMKGIRERAGE